MSIRNLYALSNYKIKCFAEHWSKLIKVAYYEIIYIKVIYFEVIIIILTLFPLESIYNYYKLKPLFHAIFSN